MLPTYRQIALAMLDAGESDNFVGTLSDLLLDVDEPARMIDATTGLISALALTADETPRTVLEQLFSKCPPDREWRAIAERWKEEREERGVDG